MGPQSLMQHIIDNKNYELHRQKIRNIMKKQVSSQDPKRTIIIQNYHSNRKRAHQAQQQIFESEVQANNAHMLKKIIRANSTKQLNHHTTSCPFLNNHPSSNLRKQSISKSNDRLAQKILAASSQLSQRVTGPQYHKHKMRKQMLQKYVCDQKHQTVLLKQAQWLKKLGPDKSLGSRKYSLPLNHARIGKGLEFQKITEEDYNSEAQQEKKNWSRLNFQTFKEKMCPEDEQIRKR